MWSEWVLLTGNYVNYARDMVYMKNRTEQMHAQIRTTVRFNCKTVQTGNVFRETMMSFQGNLDNEVTVIQTEETPNIHEDLAKFK